MGHLDRLGLDYLPGTATFYLFVSIADSSLGSEEFCTRLLDERHVCVVPGIGYGASCDRFVRVSVGTESSERTMRGLEAIRDLVEETTVPRVRPATPPADGRPRHRRHRLHRPAPDRRADAATPRVRARARSSAARLAGVRWIDHDLADDLPDTLPSAVDAVVHLAQSPAYKHFPEGAPDVFAVNVASTFALLDYARRASARSFVLASTGGIYDYSPAPIDEDAALAPSSHYFRSKYAAEVLMESYADLMATIALRFFFVYGPGQRGMLSRAWSSASGPGTR